MDTKEIVSTGVQMGIGVGGAWYSVYSLQEWVAIFTIFYVVLQIGLLIPKYGAAIMKASRAIKYLIVTWLRKRKHGRQKANHNRHRR